MAKHDRINCRLKRSLVSFAFPLFPVLRLVAIGLRSVKLSTGFLNVFLIKNDLFDDCMYQLCFLLTINLVDQKKIGFNE